MEVIEDLDHGETPCLIQEFLDQSLYQILMASKHSVQDCGLGVWLIQRLLQHAARYSARHRQSSLVGREQFPLELILEIFIITQIIISLQLVLAMNDCYPAVIGVHMG